MEQKSNRGLSSSASGFFHFDQLMTDNQWPQAKPQRGLSVVFIDYDITGTERAVSMKHKIHKNVHISRLNFKKFLWTIPQTSIHTSLLILLNYNKAAWRIGKRKPARLGFARVQAMAACGALTARQLCWRGLGSRSSARPSVCLSVCHTRALWQNQNTADILIPHERCRFLTPIEVGKPRPLPSEICAESSSSSSSKLSSSMFVY